MTPDRNPILSSSATAPFIVSIITERPGAVAILSRTAEPDSRSWDHVVRLTPPRRGKRFSRNTEAGSLLHALHADGLLGPVFINLPDAYAAISEDDTIRDPDILHLVRSLKRMGIQPRVTASPLWRPCFEQCDETGTLASIVAADLPERLKGAAHEEAQCTDALLLALFASADAPDGLTPPYRPH